MKCAIWCTIEVGWNARWEMWWDMHELGNINVDDHNAFVLSHWAMFYGCVVPLTTSHLQFYGPIKNLKNIGDNI